MCRMVSRKSFKKGAFISMFGNMGKLLRIDLTERKYNIENVNNKLYEEYFGGMGLAAYYMLQELDFKDDPLSESNKIFIAVGPLTGTVAPTSSRFGIFTKSPATDGYLESYCGGNFGKEIKHAGYDMIIIEGRSTELVYIEINDGKVNFKVADNLERATATETLGYFRAHYEGWENLYVGPAGERMSPLAGVFSDQRCAGRGGGGAVFGSKNLKGIVMKGSKRVELANEALFLDSVKMSFRDLRNSSPINFLKKQGTVNIMDVVNYTEALPVKNFQHKSSKKANFYYPENLDKKWIKSIACYNCPISCGKVSKFKNNNKETMIDGPEYETIWSLGINCDVYNFETVAYANYLCDEYGIDTISVGNIIGFIMELYEKNVITSNDLDNIKAEWGNEEALISLVNKIGRGEGIGRLLEKGVRHIAEELDYGRDIAMHVKGLEMPAFHPGGNYGIALGYAVSARGACHLHGAVLSELFGGVNPGEIEIKVEMYLKNLALCNIINSATLCYFTINGIGLKEIFLLHKYATGIEYDSPANLERIGLNIALLTKKISQKCGFTRKDDMLPERVFAMGTNKAELINLVNNFHNALEKCT